MLRIQEPRYTMDDVRNDGLKELTEQHITALGAFVVGLNKAFEITRENPSTRPNVTEEMARAYLFLARRCIDENQVEVLIRALPRQAQLAAREIIISRANQNHESDLAKATITAP